MPWNRKTFTIEGSNTADYAVSESVTIGVTFFSDVEVRDTAEVEYLNVNNDSGLARLSVRAVCYPFTYKAGSQDYARFYKLRRVCRKRFKRITATTGVTRISESGGDLWSELLASPLDVYVTEWTEADPGDDRKHLTVVFKDRRRAA